jgi:hypothetical protein
MHTIGTTTARNNARNARARDVDGNGEVSLPDLTVLALYHGQHYLQSLTIAMKITSDITNKRAQSTLNGSPACFSSWFVTIHITSDITSEKGERLCWAMMQEVFQHISARKVKVKGRSFHMGSHNILTALSKVPSISTTCCCTTSHIKYAEKYNGYARGQREKTSRTNEEERDLSKENNNNSGER